MRVLAMTSLFPNPYQPHKWSPNQQQLRLLGDKVPVDVIAPIPWTVERAGRKRLGDLLQGGRRRLHDRLNVEHARYCFPPGILRSWYGRCYRWSVRQVFERHVREFKPDIVFTHWAYPDGWAAVKLGHAAGLPVVLQVLGSDVLLLDKYPGRRRGTIEALTEANGIWAVSQDLANHLQALNVKADRVRVIYDGVDPAVFHPGDQQQARKLLHLDPSRKIILFVGNLTPVKAVDKLIDACEILKAGNVDYQADIVGDGELRPALEKQLSKMRCRKNVTLHGALPQERLPDWYCAADVLVLPSYSEGVPNVLLEASACGLPYVASSVGGIPEIADRGQGILITPGYVDALADGIRRALAQPRPAAYPVRTRMQCIEEFLQFLAAVQTRFHSFDSKSAPT